MKTASLIKAIVKYTAREPRETRNGRLRINVVATLPDGSEATLWDDPGGAISYLTKGQEITLAKDSKGYTLIATTDEAPAAPPTTTHPAQPARGDDFTDVHEMAAIALELSELLPSWDYDALASMAQSVFKYRRG